MDGGGGGGCETGDGISDGLRGGWAEEASSEGMFGEEEYAEVFRYG